MMLRMVFYAPIIGIGALFKVLHTASSMTWVIGIAVGAILFTGHYPACSDHAKI